MLNQLMFTIKFVICIQFISFIIAQNIQQISKLHDNHDIIIEPLELILRSTDKQGIFLCNSRTILKKQQNKLTVSIEEPILTPPKFLLKVDEMNSTTIRIRVTPNGYIGVNRISCHWSNNLTYGQTVDLIIGDSPGVIQLAERCLAYDRRYVQCILNTSTMARAFQNGFPRHYNFTELNLDSKSYNLPPTLVNITNKNEFIFHFEPRERNVIPKKILMRVNMTLSKFGSSVYLFNIEPLHTTNVDFRIEDISSNQFTIRINHTNTGTISQRLCSGYIGQIDDKNISIVAQDITETSDQQISIDGLSSAKEYEVCLRCYYEQTDQSYKEKKCQKITTTKCRFCLWHIALAVGVGIVVFTIGFLICRKKPKCRCRKPSVIIPVSSPSAPNKPEDPILPDILPTRYASEPELNNPLIPRHIDTNEQGPDSNKYQPLVTNEIKVMMQNGKFPPDTVDMRTLDNASET